METEAQREPRGAIRVLLDLSPETMLRALGLAILFLLVVHITLQVLHYRVVEIHWLLKDAFDVDEEQNIPTWYSAATLLFSAFLIFSIDQAKRAEGAWGTGYWRALGWGFVWLSLDEVAGIHEIFNTWMDEVRGDSEFSWAYIGAAVIGIVGLLFVRFLSRMPKRLRNGVYVSGAIYSIGVVGVEIVSNLYLKSSSIDTLGYNMLTALEEGLEMVGVAYFIYVLMSYMRTIPALNASSEEQTKQS